MRSLSTELKVWKDSQGRLVPLITLYDIEVNDSTTLRLVEGDPDCTGSVTFGGQTYTAAAITREEHDENVEGDFPSFRLQVSNINGVAGGYIEANELDGRQVTIRTGLLRGNEADFQVETYTISGASYDRKAALLQLGPPNFFKRKTCPRKYQRMRCQHNWGARFLDDAGCGYPSDTFEGDTKEQWKFSNTTNDEKARQFGWYTINALKCGSTDANSGRLEINETVPGVLHIASQAEDIEWEPGLLNAPYVYKKLSGDFDVATQILPYRFRAGLHAGILCQDRVDLTSWILFGLAIDEGWQTHVRATAAVAGVGMDALDEETSIYNWVRLVRAANVFTCYRGTDGATWTSIGALTVAMDADIRLGLCLAGARIEKGVVDVGFSVFQFRSGGDATCERTREACRLKGNVHRYGAFPGIPTRR